MRTNECLPFARRTWVARDVRVGEETELALEGRLNLTDVGAVAGEEGTLEERLGINRHQLERLPQCNRLLTSMKNWVSKELGVESKGVP